MRAHALIPRWSRAAWFRLLLVAVLAFAQQAALVHAVAHPFEVGVARPVDGKANGKFKTVEPLCEQCLAHAQLAGVAGAAFAPDFAAPAAAAVVAAAWSVPLVRFARPFDSRGPPRS